MDRAAAIADIQRGLGFRTDQVDNIIAALQQAQRILEQGRTLPWFLLLEDQELTLLEGQQTVALPSNFIREAEDGDLRYQPTNSEGWTWLTGGTYDEIRLAHSSASVGFPTHFALRTSTIWFSQPAEEDITYIWDYWGHDESLVANIENRWLEHAPDVLIGAAGRIVASNLRDLRAVEKFATLQAESWNALFRETIARETHNRPVILGRNS